MDINVAKQLIDHTGNSTLSVTGNQTVSGTLAVTGATTLTGATTQTGDLTVAGVTSMTGNTMYYGPGSGITAGTGTIAKTMVVIMGGVIKTTLLIDVTGLNSKDTDGDIIGKNGTSGNCHFGRIVASRSGTIFCGTMTCYETPAGGDPNINLYSATEATGVEDGAIGDLTETLLYDRSGDWAAGDIKFLTALPAADQYLYLTQGDATGTDATYTAGKFIIELLGY